jgi:MFS family permease
MRGRLVAVNFMASSLIGLPLGPPLAAAIAGSFYSGSHAIGYAMTAIAAVCAPVAVLAMLLSRRRFIIALDCAIRRESLPENGIHPPAAQGNLRPAACIAPEKADRSVR